jgi:multidrug transporter EmrE-like cation transporter
MFMALTILAAVFFTSGGALMKSSEGLTKLWPSILCMTCFMSGAAMQALAMRGNQMGVTHIFVLGLEAGLALFFGALFFQETLTSPKFFGTALIIIGMIVLRRS